MSERAPHVVPMEIVQKIVSKIAVGEYFIVYALIPMFPEGDPNGTAGQEILLYQWRTIDAMYRWKTNVFERVTVDLLKLLNYRLILGLSSQIEICTKNPFA